MSEIVPFHFDAHEIRVHVDDYGLPWWEAQDVCGVLGIKDTSQAMTRLPVGEKRTSETRNVLIINESGLYRLIFRSNKPEAEKFQTWVFSVVLPAIRTTGQYVVPTVEPPMLPAPKVQLTLIDQAHALLAKLGHLTERDTLMLADQVRNVMQTGQRLLPVGPTVAVTASQPLYGFSVAERVTQLGYTLTRSQQAALVPRLGKRIAEEWRARCTREPAKETRWVDGAQRPVAWYAQEESHWIDPIVQGYLSSFPGITRTTQEEDAIDV